MLWGSTLRTPHPHARDPLDRHRARRWPRPACTRCSPHEDVPGPQDLRPRDPRPARARLGATCATRARRSRSSPPTIPRPRARAAEAIEVDYEVLEPLDRSRARARRSSRRRCTRPATCCATCTSSTATRAPAGDVVVTGEYEVGMQDQAFLGPGVGPRRPRRGRRRRPLHRDPVAARRPRPARRLLDLPPEQRAAHARPASAARSAAARTSRCRSTPACSRSTPGAR